MCKSTCDTLEFSEIAVTLWPECESKLQRGSGFAAGCEAGVGPAVHGRYFLGLSPSFGFALYSILK
jgi:hypothetical protein